MMPQLMMFLIISSFIPLSTEANQENTEASVNEEGLDQVSLLYCGSPKQKASFKQTTSKYKKLETTKKGFEQLECSLSVIDTFLSSTTSSSCDSQSGEGTALCLSKTGASAASSVATKTDDCRRFYSKIETQTKEVLKHKEVEQKSCIQKANSLRNAALTEIRAAQQAKQPPPCSESLVAQEYSVNLKSCNSFAQEIQTDSQKLLALAKEHWLTISAVLGGVGTGAYMLTSSGKKQANDLTTNPTAQTPAAAASTTESSTETPETVAATPSTFQRPSDQAYCQKNLRPVECFVTPACDLACAAERYGLENYAGMSNDPRMIDAKGNIVDPTTAQARNPGASTANSTVDGSTSGNSSSSASGPGELASSNNAHNDSSSTTINTRNANAFQYDEGGGGGRFGGRSLDQDYDSFSSRDPAMTSGKNAALVHPSQTSPDSKDTGPLLEKGKNLFEAISQVSRTQCVRGLVYCNDGK